MSTFINFDSILGKEEPIHPIQDMVNHIREYRATHSKEAWDFILKRFLKDYMDDLKEGQVEFTTVKAYVLPDGSEFEFNSENMKNLILRAEYWGIELTYKLDSLNDPDKIVWVMDIREAYD